MESALPQLLAWLATVPAAVLYAVLAAAAFLENVFPPLPADTVIAVGALLAARGTGSPWGAWGATMIGNLLGAALMYRLGRRLGMPWVTRHFPIAIADRQAERIGERFASQGLVAVIVSRFLPGIRALVPPIAGAVGLPFGRSLAAMISASAVWYGLICLLAFQAGAHADDLLARIGAHQRSLAISAGAAAAVGIGILWWRHRTPSRRGP